MDFAIFLMCILLLFVGETVTNGKKFGWGMKNDVYMNPNMIMKDFLPGCLLLIFGILAETWNHGVRKVN